MRTIFSQLRYSRFPSVAGLAQNQTADLLALANECLQRLHFAGGDSGWWGAWDKLAFSVTQANPYITLPAAYARVINLAICQQAVRVQNEFYEIMEGGIGLQPPSTCRDWCGALEGFERGVFSTQVDLPTDANYYLRVYPADSADVGKKILFGRAKDQNATQIYTNAIPQPIDGLLLTIEEPYVTTTALVSGWDSITKDTTAGDIILKAVNADTGEETLLSRYLKWETNPAYRRYYLNALPLNCCDSTTVSGVSVTAMAKREFVPVATDTDQLLIGNIPALIEEAQSLRAATMEDQGAAGRAARHHATAIKLLQDEMRHYLGSRQPAVVFAPFGTANLDRQYIGRLF